MFFIHHRVPYITTLELTDLQSLCKSFFSSPGSVWLFSIMRKNTQREQKVLINHCFEINGLKNTYTGGLFPFLSEGLITLSHIEGACMTDVSKKSCTIGLNEDFFCRNCSRIGFIIICSLYSGWGQNLLYGPLGIIHLVKLLLFVKIIYCESTCDLFILNYHYYLNISLF